MISHDLPSRLINASLALVRRRLEATPVASSRDSTVDVALADALARMFSQFCRASAVLSDAELASIIPPEAVDSLLMLAACRIVEDKLASPAVCALAIARIAELDVENVPRR